MKLKISIRLDCSTEHKESGAVLQASPDMLKHWESSTCAWNVPNARLDFSRDQEHKVIEKKFVPEAFSPDMLT